MNTNQPTVKGTAGGSHEALSIDVLLRFVSDYLDAYERHEVTGEAADGLANEGWRLWELAYPPYAEVPLFDAPIAKATAP